MTPDEDDVVLSYYDAIVTVKDVQSLRHRNWLTDNIINFFVEYIIRCRLQNDDKKKNLEDSVLVMGPSVVQMLKFFEPSDFAALDCLGLSSKCLILLPLNDAEIDENGSHWSLLVYVALKPKEEGLFYHLDSMGGRNTQTANGICEVLGKYLCGSELAPLTPSDVGQQSNMFDCGIMVILFIDYIISFFAKYRSFDTEFKNYKYNLKDCRSKREDLMKLVQELHEADEK